jgi:hypothetical protein
MGNRVDPGPKSRQARLFGGAEPATQLQAAWQRSSDLICASQRRVNRGSGWERALPDPHPTSIRRCSLLTFTTSITTPPTTTTTTPARSLPPRRLGLQRINSGEESEDSPDSSLSLSRTDRSIPPASNDESTPWSAESSSGRASVGDALPDKPIARIGLDRLHQGGGLMRPRHRDPRLAAGHRDAPIHDPAGVARIPHLCGGRRELRILAGWRRQEADGAVGGAESVHSGKAGEAGSTRGTVGRGDGMRRRKGMESASWKFVN